LLQRILKGETRDKLEHTHKLLDLFIDLGKFIDYVMREAKFDFLFINVHTGRTLISYWRWMYCADRNYLT